MTYWKRINSEEPMLAGQKSPAWNFGTFPEISFLRIGFSCEGHPQLKMHTSEFQAVWVIMPENPNEWELVWWDEFNKREGGVVEKRCGTCKWWEQAEPYKWGTCDYPLPDWVEDEGSHVRFPDREGEFCSCWEPREK